MNKPRHFLLAVALMACFHQAIGDNQATPDRKLTTQSDHQEVSVTIYNEDLAMVSDRRVVRLDRGANRLDWTDVSARMIPETARLADNAESGEISLIEQDFDQDLLSPKNLLQQYVGKEVMVITTLPDNGGEKREMARVLSVQDGVVLKFADRIETGVPGRLAFPSVPENLRDKPALTISLVSKQAGKRQLELSYLTSGLSWKADYVAELNDKGDEMGLSGWVTLVNQSGTSYPNARLRLVAGNVNHVRNEMPAPRPMAMMARAADAEQMAQENLFEYHLYSLQRTTTIAENQTKQVALMDARNIPVHKEYLLQGSVYYYSGQYGKLGDKTNPDVLLEFDNKGKGLGIPLPKGIVRVYKNDSSGAAQFIGEDRIEHTPKNETVRLRLGRAFDLTADRKQTDFTKMPSTSRYPHIYESAYQITIENAKDENATVKVVEPMPGDWQILSESLPHAKAASDSAAWQVPVPAGGKAVLTYRVQVRY